MINELFDNVCCRTQECAQQLHLDFVSELGALPLKSFNHATETSRLKPTSKLLEN